MTVNVKKDGEDLLVMPEGRIDTMTAPEFEKAIMTNIDGIKNLNIDFSSLDYISSAGLRVLLATEKKMKNIGKMKVSHVSDIIMNILDMTGFSDILTIEN